MQPLDRLGKAVLSACALLFLVGVGCRLNGSSSLIWKDELKDAANPAHALVGVPQEVRSDEWLVWTPALIAQTKLGFPSENPGLGAGKAPFLYSLPVRHYTMLFRPQLYGFFVFNLEYGYAWYWNMKVFGLIAATFLLLWTLTAKSGISLFGSLFLFFSSYVQWWFSCPPMLPEMLASWAIAVVAAISLLRAARAPQRAAAAAALSGSIVSFVLCLYPPFQIPLAYLGIAIVCASAYSYDAAGSRSIAAANVLCFCAAALIAAAVLVPFFYECAPTLRILANTSYPGRRQSHGGELNSMKLFSSVVNFFNSSTRYPEGFDQVNEVANFFPLWMPLFAMTAPAMIRNRRKHAVAWACVAVIVFLSVYAVCPLPQWLCGITLLSACTGTRALLGIGVANVVFVAMMLPFLKDQKSKMSRPAIFVGGVFCAGLVLLYLCEASSANPRFLRALVVAAFFALNAGVIAALVFLPMRVFGAAFLGLLAASNALVNPIATGLDGLTKSSPRTAVEQLIRRDPKARWVAYDTTDASQLLLSMGADVVSGAKTVPNLDFYKLMDPSGQNATVYNRYSISQFAFRRDRASVGFRYLGFPVSLVSIHPRNPVMEKYNVRYFVFPKRFSHPEREGIELVCAFPQNELWVYGVSSTTSL